MAGNFASATLVAISQDGTAPQEVLGVPTQFKPTPGTIWLANTMELSETVMFMSTPSRSNRRRFLDWQTMQPRPLISETVVTALRLPVELTRWPFTLAYSRPAEL